MQKPDKLKSVAEKLGSSTARGGFRNEEDIIRKFNSWKTNKDAQKWLEIMGYDLEEIEKVLAIKVARQKTDVQVQITVIMKKAISAENISVKLVSNPQGFNQIDKRWVDNYVELWNIPPNIVRLLKLFTGEIKPTIASPRDKRRTFFDEMALEEQNAILRFFRDKKILVISDTLKGRGQLSAGWMLVILKSDSAAKWVLKSINEAMNHYGEGDVVLTSEGSLKIGRIGMQRKGGDAGRETSQMLQFKINPVELFEH